MSCAGYIHITCITLCLKSSPKGWHSRKTAQIFQSTPKGTSWCSTVCRHAFHAYVHLRPAQDCYIAARSSQHSAISGRGCVSFTPPACFRAPDIELTSEGIRLSGLQTTQTCAVTAPAGGMCPIQACIRGGSSRRRPTARTAEVESRKPPRGPHGPYSPLEVRPTSVRAHVRCCVSIYIQRRPHD